MQKTLSLILPALLPSWRFFQEIEPSPRIQWAVLGRDGKAVGAWREFRPRPARVSPWQMLARLFWNPARNDALFMVSCAERVALDGDALAIAEITRRLRQDIAFFPEAAGGNMVQFRLEFVYLDGGEWSREVIFESAPFCATAQHTR